MFVGKGVEKGVVVVVKDEGGGKTKLRKGKVSMKGGLITCFLCQYVLIVKYSSILRGSACISTACKHTCIYLFSIPLPSIFSSVYSEFTSLSFNTLVYFAHQRRTEEKKKTSVP